VPLFLQADGHRRGRLAGVVLFLQQTAGILSLTLNNQQTKKNNNTQSMGSIIINTNAAFRE
jgi:hypothetical protein